jgi:nitrate reductase delta subunit
MRTFKALSALLSYPTPELQGAAEQLRKAIRDDDLVPAAVRRHLDALIDDIAGGDIYDLQERYVLLFDRTRSLSLHLFEHVHGESRDRGQAMIDLRAQYERSGLVVSAAELPDFLPLLLEYLSTQPFAEAREMLGQTVHILSALAERLRKRRSPYEAVFRALAAAAAVEPAAEAVAALLDEADPDPGNLAALDEAWADEAVTFGPTGSSCKDGLIARIRAGRRPAPAPAAARPPAAPEA